MELYVKVCFWCGIVTLVLRGVTLSFARYPRQAEHSLGSDIVSLLLVIAQLVWACVLLYG